MNYRHAYHAGNFADVLKHAVLARTIDHLARKEAPFRVLDTHAGTGLYDLSSDEARKTGEWRGGIGRIRAAPPTPALAALLDPWLRVVRAVNGGDDLLVYPGSPMVAAVLARPQDRLVFCELHPHDGDELAARFSPDRRVSIAREDGWIAVRSRLPPPERRGVTIVDPPFEAAGEFRRLVKALRDAGRRFATGTLIAWYPLKDPAAVDAFHREARESGLARLLVAEQWIRRPTAEGPLVGAGVLVHNPPHRLAEDLAAAMPDLVERLAAGPGAGGRVDWLVPEAVPPVRPDRA
jgi:23S rRNA (adenine2030-N6)-methyltransferase